MVPEPRGRVEGSSTAENALTSGEAGSVSITYADSLATILLGQPAESAISLSVQRLESFAAALAVLEGDVAAGRVTGVVIRSPSPAIFCVGADLKLLDRIQHADLAAVRETLLSSPHLSPAERELLTGLTPAQLPELGAVLARRGQSVFARLERLRVPKVAAISGRCLGGGLELALHCDYLVAADNGSRFSSDYVTTELGFPEPLLGLLEGWGGIDKAVRRVGLRQALPLLLEGKPLGSKKALRVGLIDEMVHAEQLIERAEEIAREGHIARRRRLPFVDRLLTFTGAGRRIVERGLKLPLVGRVVSGADRALAAFPRENYPAPHAILECALHGLAYGTAAGNELAAQRFGELMMSPTAQALVHVTFFGTEAARARGKKIGAAPRHLNCLVVGAGQMGAGITHALLRAGHKVMVHDSQSAALAKARQSLEQWVGEDRQLSADDRAATLANLSFQEHLPAATAIDFAIEAVIENEAVKQKVLAAIAQAVPASAIIATNTSSIPLATLAGAVASPKRFLGVHFFNPVRKMRLVEIVAGPQSSETALAFGAALVNGMGKFPIVVRDVPGFLINRMLFPYLMEAVHLVCEGVPIDAIDRAAEEFGMVMGPLKTIDLVGFDIVRDVGRVLYPAYAERWQAPTLPALAGGSAVEWTAVVDHFIARGLLGSKAGQGFYRYESKAAGKTTKAATPNSSLGDPAFWAAIGARAPQANLLPASEIVDRLVLALINEAVRLFDEGVAGPPDAEAALQLDLGSVLGFGFAPFRGGVLYHAQALGAATIAEKLAILERQHGRRFHAWDGITQRAQRQLAFSQPLTR